MDSLELLIYLVSSMCITYVNTVINVLLNLSTHLAVILYVFFNLEHSEVIKIWMDSCDFISWVLSL